MIKFKRLINSTDKIGLIKTHIIYLNNRYIKNSPYILDEVPTRVRVETSNACNLKCITCPQNTTEYTRKIEMMDMELFNKIVDEIKQFNPKPKVVLYHGGEPLLNPNIFKCIDIVKSAKLYCYLNSNATLLTEYISNQIFKSGLDLIEFSFDDVTPTEYEKMRVNAIYETTLNNIRLFLEMKKEMQYKKPDVIITGIVMKNGSLINNIEKVQCSKLFKNLFSGFDVSFSHYYAHNWSKSLKKEYHKCNLVNHDFNILSSGLAVPCCYDLNGDLVLGNVKTESIKNIWVNEKYNNLRRKLNNKEHVNIELCVGCPI